MVGAAGDRGPFFARGGSDKVFGLQACPEPKKEDAMGVLQEDKAVFYHPLNDVWEYQNHVVDTAIAALSTTKIMVVGRDGLDGNYPKVRQGDVSGTTISFGGLSGGLGGSSQKYGIAAISSTQAVATYKDVDDSNHPNANVVTTV